MDRIVTTAFPFVRDIHEVDHMNKRICPSHKRKTKDICPFAGMAGHSLFAALLLESMPALLDCLDRLVEDLTEANGMFVRRIKRGQSGTKDEKDRYIAPGELASAAFDVEREVRDFQSLLDGTSINAFSLLDEVKDDFLAGILEKYCQEAAEIADEKKEERKDSNNPLDQTGKALNRIDLEPSDEQGKCGLEHLSGLLDQARKALNCVGLQGGAVNEEQEDEQKLLGISIMALKDLLALLSGVREKLGGSIVGVQDKHLTSVQVDIAAGKCYSSFTNHVQKIIDESGIWA
jgi:hypothetical protein